MLNKIFYTILKTLKNLNPSILHHNPWAVHLNL